jgi:hypothetical protein
LQIAEIGKLDLMLPPAHKGDPRLSRLVLALRALDARSEGVSLVISHLGFLQCMNGRVMAITPSLGCEGL